MEDFVLIGIVRKVRGIKGDLKVESLSDVPGRFSALSEVLIRGNKSAEAVLYKVEKSEYMNDYIVIKLSGIDNYDSASSLVGAELLVSESHRGVPSTGSYFIDSLIGMTVKDLSDTIVGVVEDVSSNAAQSILLIRSEKGEKYQIPFVSAFVKEVDLESNEMKVELIEGLM